MFPFVVVAPSSSCCFSLVGVRIALIFNGSYVQLFNILIKILFAAALPLVVLALLKC